MTETIPKVAEEQMVRDALALGATRAAVIEVEYIRFHPEVRRLCERNACGQYGRNWMCPPHVGTLEETAARVRRFRYGLLVQTVRPLEDSFDFEGMGRAEKEHQKLILALAARLQERYGLSPLMPLGAGACGLCARCTVIDNQPCRLPDRAMASMEAYGMNVKEVVERCGFPYIAGPNTVSYAGLILYGEA